jgi:hypothetical protein
MGISMLYLEIAASSELRQKRVLMACRLMGPKNFTIFGEAFSTCPEVLSSLLGYFRLNGLFPWTNSAIENFVDGTMKFIVD